MRSSTITLALVAAAAVPGFAAPIKNIEARSDLKARLALGAAAKALGGGIASGGIFAVLGGLLGKLGGGGEVAARSLDARGGVPPNVGAIFKGLLKGLFKGKRELQELTTEEATMLEQLEALMEADQTTGLQARGGVPPNVGAIFKGLLKGLFKGKRELDGSDDLTEEDEAALLEYLISAGSANELNARGGVPPNVGAIFKGILKGLFKGKRELSSSRISSTLEQLEALMEAEQSTGLQARGGVPPNVGAIFKGLLKGLFKGKRDLNELTAAESAELQAWLKSNAGIPAIPSINDLD